VKDNGIGFDPGSAGRPGSQGLAGLHQRMQELGGECEVSSVKGGGTTVRLILPLRST
jgi:signal transduction histidine kinase